MLNRKMVLRVMKSQSMKDKLSFILYYMIILTVGWRVGQRQKNPVGASALPTGKFLRVRKVFARIYKIDPKIKSKHCISLETFQTVWKLIQS